MSCIHITACQLACSPSAFPAKNFQLNSASICPSTYLGAKFPKISLKSPPGTSRYQQAAIVCLFGGKGRSENENEVSPWKALEKAVGNFKKGQPIQDVLMQQIQEKRYYSGGDGGGKRPGGGGGDGDGSGGGEDEDEGVWGFWDEFGQVILATMGLIFMYIYIIEGEEVRVLAKDILKFLFTRRKSIRLKRLMDKWTIYFQKMKEKQEYEDPYWLERGIINTPTCYDHPAKYKWLIKVLESNSDDEP